MIDEINDMDMHADADARIKTLFKPGSWFAKIDFINHLVLFKNVIISVLSEKEGGKTSFSALLQNNLDPQIKFYTYTAQPELKGQEILSEMAHNLNLDTLAAHDIISLVAHINEDKAHMLLVIDDAQFLPHDFLKEMIEAIKKQDDFGFFHLCLISDHSIVSTLNAFSDTPLNDLIHTIELSSLNENETRTYVLHRLMANNAFKKVPTDAQFREFYQLTKGNMSKINNELSTFVSGCCNKKQNKKIYFVQCASLLICAALVIKASFWHLSMGYTPKSQSILEMTSILPTIPDSTQISTLALSEGNTGTISKLAPIPMVREQLVSQIPSWQQGSLQIEVVQFEDPINLLEMNLDEDEITTNVALIDKVIVIPKLKNLSESNAKNTPQTSQFTIQLLASHDKKDIESLKKSNPLLKGAKIKTFTNENGLWYVLVYGEYKNKNEAKSHIKSLHTLIAQLTPWVRSMSGLENIG
ncbi:MAG: SPOR domain-containing protein [Legionella sp.]|nr:SPOR domain-containing protein [Legionella sp.]